MGLAGVPIRADVYGGRDERLWRGPNTLVYIELALCCAEITTDKSTIVDDATKKMVGQDSKSCSDKDTCIRSDKVSSAPKNRSLVLVHELPSIAYTPLLPPRNIGFSMGSTCLLTERVLPCDCQGAL